MLPWISNQARDRINMSNKQQMIIYYTFKMVGNTQILNKFSILRIRQNNFHYLIKRVRYKKFIWERQSLGEGREISFFKYSIVVHQYLDLSPKAEKGIIVDQ